MDDVKKSIQLLFVRPSEPLFMPKGDTKAVFDLPFEFMSPKYETMGIELNNKHLKHAGERIPLKNLSLANLSEASELSHNAEFSLFIPKHRRIAATLIDIFLKVPLNNLDDFLSTAVFYRERVNAQLFHYCLSVALLHREDTKNISLPNFMQSFPSKFVDSQIFQEVREVCSIMPKDITRRPIIIPRDFSGSDLNEEQRLAYFREDIGINLHHWHWHLVYPFSSANLDIVRKDRRGELFFYMHQQAISRYNGERLCNNLSRVKRFNNYREPIAEGYYPKLESFTSGRSWTPRQADSIWKNVNRPNDGIIVSIEQLEKWRDRIDDAISLGYYLTPNGEKKQLTIDILGNIIEASDISPNPVYYGDFHNTGHLLTSFIHDPDNKYLEPFGIITAEPVAMRDPFFYRWHATVDNIFQKFKSSPASPPYDTTELNNPNITITSVVIDGEKENEIQTFWMSSDVDISHGLDFTSFDTLLIRLTHLNHTPFTYVINITNSSESKLGTVRIFIAPKYDELKMPWQLEDQRHLFIEMDRFITTIQSGSNTIKRRSDESSVTIPFERTFRPLLNYDPRVEDNATMTFNQCGCGWPQHMLVPKGTLNGSEYELFVMVSNYELDMVEQDMDNVICSKANTFCGVRDRLYPDQRSMGYPFDRAPNDKINNIKDFLQPNMIVQNIKIKFLDKTIMNPNNPTN